MNLAINLVIQMAAYLCECITQLLCIHAFLGKKIKVDVKMVVFVIVDILSLMLIINTNGSSMWTLVINIFFMIYIWCEFHLKIAQCIILMLFNVLVGVSMQAIANFNICILFIFFGEIKNNYVMGLLINILALVFMFLFTHWIKWNKLYIKIIKWDDTIFRILLMCGILFTYLIISFKIKNRIEVLPYFISAIMACIVIFIVFNWQKDKYEMKQKSLELYMHELYGKTVEGMIENIRIRQHDFKNQIAAIYGMHLTAESFEELVERQKEYCDFLMEESRYDSILTKCKDRILAGFLYTKFTECEKKGMEIDFDISVNNSEFRLGTYEIIEIVGILLDNAVEYEKGKDIYFKIDDSKENLIIVCRNKADYMSMDKIEKFFKKGYSTKGENRGIGLYNVKKLLNGNGEINVLNKEIAGFNWLEFEIHINKD